MNQLTSVAQFFVVRYLSGVGAHAAVLAYLDPGSGSYLLQLLIAAALGGLVLLRLYWAKVKAFVRRVFTGKDEEVDVDE